MNLVIQRQIAVVCVISLLGVTPATGADGPQPQPLPKEVFDPLQQDLRRPYLELFESAAKLEYSPAQLERMRQYLRQTQSSCVARFEARAKESRRSLTAAQEQLKRIGDGDQHRPQRHDLHCRIQEAQAFSNQADVIARHAIPVAYDNKLAKLELIEHWPAEEMRIREAIRTGAYRHRKWADVEDIGFRGIEPDQKDDIKMGQDAVREMKIAGLLLKEIDNDAVTGYVRGVARRIAENSDLQVPLQVTILDSKEVNAFALPGGFIFIERGLLESVEDESQLAGVIAHEMSHVVLRHGRKLMRRATIASIIYQAAQIAALLATGGMVGIGAYYALQYGFFGLGLTLNLALIGVSRDFEREADQLGVQYAWKAGYDPGGFIRFFDRMATREGYANGASWFRTHPPFYERMSESQRELLFVGRKSEAVLTTTAFAEMKRALRTVTRKAVAAEAAHKPSLLAREKDCPPPAKPLFEPDQPIETICSSPGAVSSTNLFHSPPQAVSPCDRNEFR